MNISNSDMAARMEQNFINSYRTLGGVKGAKFQADAGSASFFSDYPLPWLNCVLRTDGSSPTLTEQVQQTLATYGQNCPLSWRIGTLSNQPEAVKEVLIEHGFKYERCAPGMIATTEQLQCSPANPDFEIKILEKPQHIDDFLVPFSESFATPVSVTEHFYRSIQAEFPCSETDRWFIGYMDGKPVSSASYSIYSDIIMLYNVTTLKAFRKHGFGRLIVEAAIKDACRHASYPAASTPRMQGVPCIAAWDSLMFMATTVMVSNQVKQLACATVFSQ